MFSDALDQAHTLESLRQMLCDTPADDLPAVLDCFEALAFYREAVAGAARRTPPAAALSGLGARLHILLEQFERQVRGGVIDLRIAGPTVAAAICSGLGVLPAMLDAGLMSKAAEKDLGKTAAQLTRALTVAVTAAPEASDPQRTGDMLAMLTWLSRGLKAGLLANDDRAVRDAFSAVLDRMPEWAAAPAASGLDGYKLASCFVQINTIRQFALLHLDGDGAGAQANRRRLQDALRSLCVALPDIFSHAAGANGVQTTNVGNTIKDFVDAGLLPRQTHLWLMPVIRVLLQRMPRVPQRDMLHGGGQVLANCGNFLRMVSESGLDMESGFSDCRDAWQAGCAYLTGMLAQDGFVLRGRIGQSLANLMSFVRAMALQDERRQPASQAQLKAAAYSLTRLLEGEDLQRLSPMSISGMLSALCTFWGRGLAPAAACRALTQGLIAAIPACAGRQWDSATVVLSLRAIVQLHDMNRRETAEVQAAFQRLLQLLAKKPVHEEAQRLYCLKAIRLGLQEKWTSLEQAELQAALRRLLRWEGRDSPGIAQLETAIASLRHREEAAPARLEMVEETGTATPAPLQAGTAARTPPGGKPAAGGMPAYRQETDKARASTSYRAPAATTTAAVSMTTSTTAAAWTSRTRQKPASSHAGRNAAPNQASPVTQWFTLASGPERGAALIEKMARLASSGKLAGTVTCTDQYGDGALYYAVVNGKPELVQWLLRHPEFSLGMSAQDAQAFVARLDSDILSASRWREAKEALALVAEAVRALSGAEQEDSGGGPNASASSSPASRSENPGRPAKQPSGKGRKARPGKHRTADRQDVPVQAGGTTTNIVQEFLQKFPGKAAFKEVAGRIQNIARAYPDLVDARFDTDAFVANPEMKDYPRRQTDAERIVHAIDQDDMAEVRRLLRTEEGKTWARTLWGNQGHTPIMVAAFDGKAGLVEALLDVDQGALAGQASTGGDTALLSAATAGHLDVLKILLRFDHGRLALQTVHAGYNVLMVAAESGRNHCVKYLLAWQGGKLARHSAANQQNALTLAARNGHVDVVRTLLGYDDGAIAALPCRDNSSAMTEAAMSGHAEVVKFLLDWRDGSMAWSTLGGFTPLLLAAQAGHGAVLKVLLESNDGALLAKFETPDGRNALELAEQSGHTEAAQLLRAHDGGSLVRRASPTSAEET